MKAQREMTLGVTWGISGKAGLLTTGPTLCSTLSLIIDFICLPLEQVSLFPTSAFFLYFKNCMCVCIHTCVCVCTHVCARVGHPFCQGHSSSPSQSWHLFILQVSAQRGFLDAHTIPSSCLSHSPVHFFPTHLMSKII